MRPISRFSASIILCVLYACLINTKALAIEPILQTGHTASVQTTALYPNGQWLLSGGLERTIKIWETYSGKEVAMLSGHGGDIAKIKIFNDNRHAASVGEHDGTVKIWDIVSHQLVNSIYSSNPIGMFTLSPDNHLLLTSSLEIISPLDNVPIGILDKGIPREKISAMAFSSDSTYVAIAYDTGNILLWDIESHKVYAEFKHTKAITDIVFSPDQKTLASSDFSGLIRLWDIEKREATFQWDAKNSVLDIEFINNGKNIISGGKDKKISLWELGKPSPVINKKLGYIINTLTPVLTSDSIIIGGQGNNLELWQFSKKLNAWNRRITYQINAAIEKSFLFSRSGKEAISISNGHNISFWNLETGLLTRSFPANMLFDNKYGGSLDKILFTPDHKLLLGIGNSDIRIWKTPDYQDITNDNVNFDKKMVYTPLTSFWNQSHLVSARESYIRVQDISKPNDSTSYKTMYGAIHS